MTILSAAVLVACAFPADASKLHLMANPSEEDVQLGSCLSMLLCAFVCAAIYFAIYRLGLFKGLVVHGVRVDKISDALATEVDQKTKAQLASLKTQKMGIGSVGALDLEATAVLDAVLDNPIWQNLSQMWQQGCKNTLFAINDTAHGRGGCAMLDINNCADDDGLLAYGDDLGKSNALDNWYNEKLDFSTGLESKTGASTDLFAPLDKNEDLKVLPAAPILMDDY